MAPSPQTRRLAFSLTLVAVVALIVVGAVRISHTPAPTVWVTATATVHDHSYRYDPQVMLPSDETMQPGQSFTVKWIPQLQLVKGPTLVGALVTLYGPYASRDAAQHAVPLASGRGPTTTPVAVSAPVAYTVLQGVLNGVNSDPTSWTLTLPHAVTPGYYLLVALATSDDIPTFSYVSAVLTIVGGAP